MSPRLALPSHTIGVPVLALPSDARCRHTMAPILQALPEAAALQQQVQHGREHHGAQGAARHAEAVGQAAAPLEVAAHHQDTGTVGETAAAAAQQTQTEV